jgi:uncharacterized protein YvpB
MFKNRTLLILLLPILFLLLITACNPKISVDTLQYPKTTTQINSANIQYSKTPLDSINPTPTASITATRLPTSTLFPTSTVVPSLTPKPSPTPIPDEHYITGIFGHRQYYAISCESSSAADWASFFGVQIYESDIQFSLPTSDNPEKGFVGDVNDPWGQTPPYSYGVHAAPIAQVLKEDFKLPAKAAKGFTLEEVKAELATDQPIIAWVIGNMVGGFPAEYKDKNGQTTIVAAYEHTVILTGYSADHIRYLNNGRFYEVPNEVFFNSWGVLGNMVVFYDDQK